MSRHVLKRLSPGDLIAAVVARVSQETGLVCTTNPNDEESPFFAVSFVGSRPGKSKALRLDVYSLQLHAISKPSYTQAEVLELIGLLEEAMEKDIALPCPFSLVRQDEMGVLTVKRDPTREWHAIVLYELTVSYGLMIK